jgi:cardiolipin synthase C
LHAIVLRRPPPVLLPLLLLLLAGCASLAPRQQLPDSHVVPFSAPTPLDQTIGEAEKRHEDQSGFRLIPEGPEAFALRARGAQLAGRSLDVQTYIWHADMTGGYLAQLIIEAADRGVKVRLLVDDMNARGDNFAFAALDAHENIEVRMFNPFASRDGMLGFLFEAAGSFRRINRRMHNKSWIVDNRIAIIGGRNLGDEYFGASDETNFVDLDFALVGPIVREASASFDRYWNAEAAYPMSQLSPSAVTAENLARLRARLLDGATTARSSRFASELKDDDAVQRLMKDDWPMHWSSRYRFVSDDPLKVQGKESGLNGSEVLAFLVPLLRGAQSELSIISPYFVPGKDGTKQLVTQAQAGQSVQVLTNSLAANDVAAVYGGYSQWREKLLRGGVKIWELKPLHGDTVEASMFGSQGASLHTKALVIDSETVFVGSYNLDPRSTSLNCEQGIFVQEPVVAGQLQQIFLRDSNGEHSWSVTLQDGKLLWSDGKETFDKAPAASVGRRFQAWLARILPVDSQL